MLSAVKDAVKFLQVLRGNIKFYLLLCFQRLFFSHLQSSNKC